MHLQSPPRLPSSRFLLSLLQQCDYSFSRFLVREQAQPEAAPRFPPSPSPRAPESLSKDSSDLLAGVADKLFLGPFGPAFEARIRFQCVSKAADKVTLQLPTQNIHTEQRLLPLSVPLAFRHDDSSGGWIEHHGVVAYTRLSKGLVFLCGSRGLCVRCDENGSTSPIAHPALRASTPCSAETSIVTWPQRVAPQLRRTFSSA